MGLIPQNTYNLIQRALQVEPSVHATGGADEVEAIGNSLDELVHSRLGVVAIHQNNPKYPPEQVGHGLNPYRRRAPEPQCTTFGVL
jgi:hypothetical protein